MESILSATSVSIFDPRTIYSQRIADQRLAYLDNNVWIELRDTQSQEALACREACYESRRNGRVLFPLSFATITEAIEIPDPETRARHATLLDDLSDGVTFRTPEILFRVEGRKAAEWYFLDKNSWLERQDVFTSVPGHLGDISYDVPAAWSTEMLKDFLAHAAADPRMRSVRFIAELFDWRTRHAKFSSMFVREMHALRTRQAAQPRLPKQQEFEKALQEERIVLLRRYFIHGVSKHIFNLLGPEKAAIKIDQFLQKNDGGPQALKKIFKRMPMLDQYARMLAQDSIERNRKPQAQDFFDFDHATAPTVHSDAFVTLDRRLARLAKDGKRCSAAPMTSLNELRGWLEAGSPNCKSPAN